MNRKRTIRQNILLASAVALVLFICLFPFLQIVSVSFKHQFDWGNPSLLPQKINTTAYAELLGMTGLKEAVLPDAIKRLVNQPGISPAQKKRILAKYHSTRDIFPYPRYFLNSFLLAMSAAVVAVVFSVFGAYGLTRLRISGGKVIQRGMLFIYMVGGVMLMVPLFQISVYFGLVTSAWGALTSLLIIYVIQTLPVALYMLGNYFRSIPFALEEAATVDGHSRLSALFHIILPLSLPMVVTVIIYCFIIAWNEFLFASVFLKYFPDFYTLPLALQGLFVSKNAIWDRIMAASVLTLVPVLVCFGFMTRHLTEGLMEGGLKS